MLAGALAAPAILTSRAFAANSDTWRVGLVGCGGRGMGAANQALSADKNVVLTAIATVLAMIPLTRSVFWGPMAIAVMGGLTVATLLTIFFVPALYAAWFRVARQSVPEASSAERDLVLAS